MLQVDARLLAHDFKSVDNSAHTPGPCAVGSYLYHVGVYAVDGLGAAFLGVRHHLREVECYAGNVAALEYLRRQRSVGESYAYHGGERPVAFGIFYSGREVEGFASVVHCHAQGVIVHESLDAVAAHYRLFAYFVVVELLNYFGAVARPVIESG